MWAWGSFQSSEEIANEKIFRRSFRYKTQCFFTIVKFLNFLQLTITQFSRLKYAMAFYFTPQTQLDKKTKYQIRLSLRYKNV